MLPLAAARWAVLGAIDAFSAFDQDRLSKVLCPGFPFEGAEFSTRALEFGCTQVRELPAGLIEALLSEILRRAGYCFVPFRFDQGADGTLLGTGFGEARGEPKVIRWPSVPERLSRIRLNPFDRHDPGASAAYMPSE